MRMKQVEFIVDPEDILRFLQENFGAGCAHLAEPGMAVTGIWSNRRSDNDPSEWRITVEYQPENNEVTE